jgi:hypothetical protein
MMSFLPVFHFIHAKANRTASAAAKATVRLFLAVKKASPFEVG